MELVPCEKISTFDHIIDNLYLGDVESATSSKVTDNNIEIIVNVSNSRYSQFTNIEYHHYDIDDESSVEIYEYFDKFVNLINIHKTRNILVHCQNSVSRSVTLVLVYLISSGKTLLNSYEFLNAKRTQYTSPNRGFIKQLSVYEMQKHGKLSIDPIAMFKLIKR